MPEEYFTADDQSWKLCIAWSTAEKYLIIHTCISNYTQQLILRKLIQAVLPEANHRTRENKTASKKQ